MQGEQSLFIKARFYSNVAVLYAATLLFAWYLINPYIFVTSEKSVVYEKAPLPEAVIANSMVPGRTVISGKPIRIIIIEADNGLSIDLPIEEGLYDENNNSWSLSENNAHFAIPSMLANNTAGTTLIYGHNKQNVFGHLSALHENAGAYAKVHTANGHIFTYTYQTHQSVMPDDTSVFKYTGDPILAVQTCGGSFFEYRQIFYFKLTSVDDQNV